ncbi:MAG: hypothetical protein ACOC78_04060 [Actinomycetota bacterium]
MEEGLSAISHASAVLFGMVIVALEFAYSAALSRIEEMDYARRYIWWVMSAGVNCCIYFIYCFVVSLHLLRTRYSFWGLTVITAVASFFMLHQDPRYMVSLPHVLHRLGAFQAYLLGGDSDFRVRISGYFRAGMGRGIEQGLGSREIS